MHSIRMMGWLGLFGLASMIGACGSPTPVPVIPTQVLVNSPIASATQSAAATLASTPIAIGTPASPTPTGVRTPTQTFTPAPTASPTPDRKGQLLAALDAALAKIKSYRVKVPEESRVIEVILPARWHQLETSGLEVIQIGTTSFVNITAAWRKIDGPSVPPHFDRVNLMWFRSQIAQAQQTSLIGPSTLDGTPVIGYQSSVAVPIVLPPNNSSSTRVPPQPSSVTVPVKIWIGATDGMPRRIEYGAPIGASVTFYDYNAKFDIDPPGSGGE